MPCAANSSEVCGGPNLLTVYWANRPGPVTNLGTEGWRSQGCWTDYTDGTTRALPVGLGISGAKSMTVDLCTAACGLAGYSLAGLEYSEECWCGHELGSISSNASLSDCNMPCRGNSSELCGAGYRLDLYASGIFSPPSSSSSSSAISNTASSSVATQPLSTTSSELTSSTSSVASTKSPSSELTALSATTSSAPAPMTSSSSASTSSTIVLISSATSEVSTALTTSASATSTTSLISTSTSLEPSVTTSSVPAAVSSTSLRNPITTSHSSSSSSSISSTAPSSTSFSEITLSSTSKISTPTTPAGVNAADILPFVYQGCFVDNGAGGRVLTNQQPGNNAMTVESCVATCSSLGYSIAGMEYASQCFCDSYIHNSPALVSESQCNMRCAGSSLEYCGAGNRLSVYSNGTMTPYQTPQPLTSGLPGNWTYQGCLSDSGTTRTLPYMISFPQNNSNEYCISLCQAFGYGVAGTEYGEQCFCGDYQNIIDAGAQMISNSSCNMLCANNTGQNGGEICGGPDAISLYQWTGAPMNSWQFASGNAAGAYEFLIGGVVIPLVTAPARNGKITYLEKWGTGPPNSTGAYELDLTLLDNFTAAWRPMHVKTDIFCSASLTLPDKVGRQINIGGWSLPSTEGIRLYWPDGKPGQWGTNDWQENADELHLLTGRWYPSAMTMANGTILVVGGENGSNGAPVPSLELLPQTGNLLYCDYLERTDPYNLYPFLIVLPSGGIFIGYYNEARILDPVSLETRAILPNIPGAVNNAASGRTYPFEGTAVILPQIAPYSDPLTVLICGGSNPGAAIALDNCVSISPDEPNANWTLERMPSKRVMPCIAALPDGTFLILNGAHQGTAGFGLATDPNLNAVLYDPTKPIGHRMTVMANTTVARLYHSEAVLLDDGRVLVSGSDPEDNVHPQEYRNEIFIPPYLMANAPRPAFVLTALDWAYGASVSFPITAFGTGPIASYRVALMGSVASTHGNSMGQRTYFPATTCAGSQCTVVAPPNANICPPSWFQVFLLDADNIPSNATWVRIGGDPAELGNWPPLADFSTPGLGAVEPLF